MTLAEFEKLLDAFEGACYDVNVYGVPHTRRKPKRRQALLDAFAEALQSADDASDGCNHFKIAWENADAKVDALRAEVNSLESNISVLAATQCAGGCTDEYGNWRCKYQDQADALQKRLDSAAYLRRLKAILAKEPS